MYLRENTELRHIQHVFDYELNQGRQLNRYPSKDMPI